MANPEVKPETFALHILNVAKASAFFVEDIARAVLGFIPNGLNLIYDFIFKSLPLFGKFFAHRWVEQVMKLCTGITIGQGLAGDLAYYLFRPLGYVLGIILGAFVKKIPEYQGQVGKVLYRLSAQTVGGALVGAGCFLLVWEFANLPQELFNVNSILLAMFIGALLGLLAKGMFLFAVNYVNSANASAARKNVQRAKELNTKLKNAARLKAKSMILMHAQDIVQQMNGPQSAQYLESFFEQEYGTFSEKIYQKLDRHFNYLADRACHGDIDSLKRLQSLAPKTVQQPNSKASFEILVERMFNARAIFKLKDDVDTAFDRWQYRFLSVKESV